MKPRSLFLLAIVMVWISLTDSPGRTKQSKTEVLQKLKALVTQRDSANSREVSLKVIAGIKQLPSDSDSLEGVFNIEISTSFYDMKQYDSAKYYLLQALSAVENSNLELLKIEIYDKLGIVISDFGDNNLAIEYYQKALEIADLHPDQRAKEWAAKINGNIGGIYYDFEDFEMALYYTEKAHRIREEHNLDSNYGAYQMRLGLSNLGLGNYTEAKEQLQNSVAFFEEHFNPLFLQYGYINVSRVYIELDELDEAEKNLQKTAALTDSISALAESATISELLAIVEFKRGRFNRSMEYAQRSLEVSFQHKMKIKEMHAYNILYKIDSARGNYRNALTLRNKFIQLSDSIRSQETLTKIAELETKYETQKKEQEIRLANAEIEKKERYQQFLLIVIVLILIMSVGGYLLLNQRFHLRRQLLSEEINNLRLQLNAFLGHGNEKLELEMNQINEKLEHGLTDREFTILQLALSDKNNKQIAETAFVSVNTVKFHLKNIYDKLGVSNRKEAFEFIISPSQD